MTPGFSTSSPRLLPKGTRGRRQTILSRPYGDIVRGVPGRLLAEAGRAGDQITRSRDYLGAAGRSKISLVAQSPLRSRLGNIDKLRWLRDSIPTNSHSLTRRIHVGWDLLVGWDKETSSWWVGACELTFHFDWMVFWVRSPFPPAHHGLTHAGPTLRVYESSGLVVSHRPGHTASVRTACPEFSLGSRALALARKLCVHQFLPLLEHVGSKELPQAAN